MELRQEPISCPCGNVRFHAQWSVASDTFSAGNAPTKCVASSRESFFDNSATVPRVSNETSVSILIDPSVSVVLSAGCICQKFVVKA